MTTEINNVAIEFIAPHLTTIDWFSGQPKKGQTLGLKVVEVMEDPADPERTVVRLQFVPVNVS
jgi:hypothetical protein